MVSDKITLKTLHNSVLVGVEISLSVVGSK